MGRVMADDSILLIGVGTLTALGLLCMRQYRRYRDARRAMLRKIDDLRDDS